MMPTRRRLLIGAGATGIAGLAGCSGSSNNESTGSNEATTDSSGESSGSSSSDTNTFEVGYGDYQTTVSADAFPETLYIYAVQTGWSNWGALMESFNGQHGVALNDDQRSSGEALSHARQNAQDPNHSAMNGGYTYGVIARNDGLTQPYKPANYDKVPDALKTDDGHVTATRRMTTAVTYRADLYEEKGIEPPETWDDLKTPEIAESLVFQPPPGRCWTLRCALDQ